MADHLQLSKATVSRSLRDDPLIRPKTRAKVHATALRMGYEGRPRGTRLRSKAAAASVAAPAVAQGTLGFLFPSSSLERAYQDSNFVQIMHGAMAEAERLGMMLMVQTIEPGTRERMDENPDQVPPMIRQKACRAVMVWGMLQQPDVAYLAGNVPVVTLGRIYEDLAVDAVMHDNVFGVRSLVAHLAERGHRRLAWVGSHYDATFIEERQAGFVTGCLKSGLDLHQQVFLGKEMYAGARTVPAEALLQAVRDGATAFVCGNDSMAGQVIDALESNGLRVPHDISVTGFDGHRRHDGGATITGINPRFAELGRAAVRVAISRLAQSAGAPTILTVRGEFVGGDTTGPVKE